jgi:hypothetical protein
MKNTMAMLATLTTAWWVAGVHALPAQAADKPPADAKPAGEPAAGAPAPGQMPKPAPENDVIKKSNGTWKCDGTAKGPDGHEMKYKSTWTIKSALGGHWFAVVYKRSKMGPMPPFEGNAFVGYNAVEKKYSFVGFDNVGGWVNLSSADAVVFNGEGAPMGHKSPVKFTFTPGKDKDGKESAKLFDVLLDFGAASSNETCKK